MLHATRLDSARPGEPVAPPDEAVQAGAGAPVTQTDREETSLEILTARLRGEYPNREAIVRGGDAVPRALLEFADRHHGDVDKAAEVGEARQLAAEAYVVLGRRAEALRVYAGLASMGPLDTHRALGLFVLGQDQFLRERYVSTARRRGADYYWNILKEKYGDSEWARRAERPMRYIGFLKGGREAPGFTQVFERFSTSGQPPAKESYSADGLRGQVVLIVFWTASTPGQGERVKALASGLASNLKEYPDLEGKVQALGVNLDSSRDLFETAVAAWDTPWPECHDGQGFRTPLAEAFAIPRVPHWVVIEAAGRVVFIGSDFDRFLAAASRELRRVRGVTEE